MKEHVYYLPAILTVLLLCFAFAQEPVLFDGTNPVVLSFQAGSGQGAIPSNDSVPRTSLISPDELAKSLRTVKRAPLILNVGPRSMYIQAHIPGSEYIGPASSEAGLAQLRKRVESLPRTRFIVLYCGCCPWDHCPNVKPADEALQSMGFKNFKVLYIANNFGSDWVNQGFPVAKGD